jgi:hypothetical protein
VSTGKYRFIPESHEVHNLLNKEGSKMSEEPPKLSDTQFAGSARIVARKVYDIFDGDFTVEAVTKIIAQYASLLVKHTIEQTEHIDLDRLSSDEHVLRIPDMAAWPEGTD